jgi:hypothetical protein
MSDRYLKIVLTVIALELFWIGLKDFAAPVSAQQPEGTRVVITGIDIAPGGASRGALPVMVRATDAPLRIQSDRPLKIEADRALKIEADRPVVVHMDRAIKIEADRPIKVENVGYTPAQRPGE